MEHFKTGIYYHYGSLIVTHAEPESAFVKRAWLEQALRLSGFAMISQ
jgi:hypothetical protein